MKKKSHLYGVLLAAGSCTLALASSGTGPSIVFTPQHPTADENPGLNDGKPAKRVAGKLTLPPEQLAQVLHRASVRKQVSLLSTDGTDVEEPTVGSTIVYDEKMPVFEDSVSTSITVTHETDGTVSLTIKNAWSANGFAVGNITLHNVDVEQKDGYEVISTSQTIAIEAGDDTDDVSEEGWLGPQLGKASIELSGKLTPEKIYLSVTITSTDPNTPVIVGQDSGFDESSSAPGEKEDQPEVNPGLGNKFTQTLWDSDVDNSSIMIFSEGCTIINGTVSFNGGTEKTYVIGPYDEDEYYRGWRTASGYTYEYSGTISSDKKATVYPCLLGYDNDENQLSILRNGVAMLDSANNYTSDFHLYVENVPDNMSLLLGFITDEDTTGTTPAIQVSTNKVTACFENPGTLQPWSAENSLPGLGLSEDLYGDKYTMACADSLTTLGLLYQSGTLYVTGINTTATRFAVPASVNINGQVNQLNVGRNGTLDWSACTSLKELDITQASYINIDFSGSPITDLYYLSSDSYIPGSYRNTENIYLHLPFTAQRGNYYDFKRVLLGVEQPNFPEPYNSSFFVVPGEDANDFFSISKYNGQYRVAEIFTDKDTITLPSVLPYTGSNGAPINIYQMGVENQYSSGLLCRKAPNLKSVIVPEHYNYMYVSWSSNSKLSELHLQGSAVPSTYWNLRSDMTVYAPSQSLYDLLTDDSSWNRATIVPEGWDFEWMTVDVKRKGEFAQTYIEMTEADWALGHNVKVTGTLNTTDLQNLKKMTNLRKLDLSEAQFTTLPGDFMENQTNLMEVTLPETVGTISDYAFAGCSALKKVTAPGVKTVNRYAFSNCSKLTDFDLSQVTSIGYNAFNGCTLYDPAQICSDLTALESYAFSNSGLTQMTVPEGISKLASSVFSNCSKLTQVTLPSQLTEIGSSAFQSCTSLKGIELPESLTAIGSSAFYGCKQLKELTIPSNVQSVGGSFISNCDSLLTVKCKAVVPPTTSGSFTNGLDLNRCVLYVVPFAIDAYREASNWSNFYIIKALEEPVKNIYINRPMTFDLQSQDDAVLQGNPNMKLAYGDRTGNNNSSYVGQLTANGDGTLSAGVFDIQHKMGPRNYYYSDGDYRTSLVNNAEHMRADSVVCRIDFEKNTWHFISFQYDVKMADIQPLYGTDFVIREYDSAKRAGVQEVSTQGMGGGSSSEQTESNWTDVPADGTLLAGKGYIIQVANNSTDSLGYTNPAVVVFPSRNTLTKNKLFASTNVIVPLEEYPAEFAHNRSWNLVGNPYPCYFDLHYLLDDFSTPIVLWRGSSYQAYSPVDDDVILRPNEAFFVQRPLDQEQMVFSTEGRMHYSAANSSGTTPGAKAPAADRRNAARSVFNFLVAGNGCDDRTRIVMNEQASAGYDSRTDASKFFAEKATGIELYVNADTRYDICERPMGNGTANLGLRVGKAGTYTLSLNGRNTEGWTVQLTDTQTGRTVKLNEQDYIFEATAGEQPLRFQLSFTAAPTTGLEGVTTTDPDAQVRVVNTAGLIVFQGRFADFQAQAPTGVYVVIEGSKSYKVVVK